MESTDQRTFLYRIDAKSRFTFVNQEWLAFAQENQAPELTPEQVLGQQLDRYIAGQETKLLYEMIYERVRKTGRDIHLPFRCDSPDEKRDFRMRIAALEEGGLEFTVQVVRIERRPPVSLLDNSVGHAATFLVICSWCKRIRLDDDRWVEIEQATAERELFGAAPPSLTHGVCSDCLANIRSQLDT
jgi:hypothetical protein